MVDPCKTIERPLNKILDGVDIVIRKLVDALNLVITGINLDLMLIVDVINDGIIFFNEFGQGFLYHFNDIMRDCKSIVRMLVKITSGTIVGWLYLFYSPIITMMFSFVGIDMDLALLATFIKYIVLLMIFGNIYNLFDILSSTYNPNTNHYIGNCNSY